MFTHCSNCKKLLMLPRIQGFTPFICYLKEQHDCVVKRLNKSRFVCSECTRNGWG